MGVVAATAGLPAWAGISLARSKRLTAALTAGSAVEIAASTARHIYATTAGKFEV